MDALKINYATLKKTDSSREQKILDAAIERMKKECERGYETDYASLFAPYDSQTLADIEHLIALKKALAPSVMIVIGIGGSNLGALAVHHALHGLFYNESSGMKVYWADSPDSSYIEHIRSVAESVLQSGKKILITVISKSGTTTETIALFELFYELLRTYIPRDYARYVVAITDKDSRLWHFAQQETIASLIIPHRVGGRYSIFSAAGLFPLGMLGVPLAELVHGAQQALVDFFDQEGESDASQLALALYHAYKDGINIVDYFVMSKSLESFGQWMRQLIAESLGKSSHTDGRKEAIGITPTVSVGTQDLHSVAQLYLAGPHDKITLFVYPQEVAPQITLPTLAAFEALVPSLQGKSLAEIMGAIFNGVQEAYCQDHRLHITIELPRINAFFMAYAMQIEMIKVMLLGNLLDVNPFDQPEVELYKKVTRKLLAHG